MWRLRKNNLIISDSDNFFVHKVHLERLLHAKPLIQNNSPIIPSFFKKKLSSKELLRTKRQKIYYENAIIFNRLLEINNSLSNYSYKNKPAYCPAFDKRKFTYNKIKNIKNRLKENRNLFTRLIKQKSHYPTQLLLNINNYENYIRGNIRRQRGDNPNIKYATFKQFKINIIKRYGLSNCHSSENIKSSNIHKRRLNCDTDIMSRNKNYDCGISPMKSYKDINTNNNYTGSLSTMITIKPSKNISRSQSAFMRGRRKKFNNTYNPFYLNIKG